MSLARRLVIVAALAATSACRAGHGGKEPARSRDTSEAAGSAARGAERSRAATDSEWTGRAVARVEELFEGRFPGVRVFYSPGLGISVRIRGATSVMGSNEPLYVIDGFPIDAGPGGLVALNPQDIAKIEILKDASSTALYGVRGANGVVVITTKRNR